MSEKANHKTAEDFWDEPGSSEDRGSLILGLRSNGIRDAGVLRAIERVPRRLFLDSKYRTEAYLDRALPIECGQTISAPFVVALMTEALDLKPEHRVLEVGTGSGYQTAILALLANHVYTVDRYRTLVDLARDRLRSLRIDTVSFQVGDGYEGWPGKAPFDRIMVTAAAPEVPERLKDQLAHDGILVIPVGAEGAVQDLLKVSRVGANFETTHLAHVRFVPMVAGVAEHL